MHAVYVRRRIAAVALVSLVVLGVPAAANALGGTHRGTEVRHVVQRGDTVWEVAVQLDPGSDPRETVARLVEENDLDGATIVPGQVLSLRAG